MSKNLNKDIDKSVDKNINKNEYYVRYAFEDFTKKMSLIKVGIKNQVVEDLMKKHPDKDKIELEVEAMKKINEKLLVMVKVEFDG